VLVSGVAPTYTCLRCNLLALGCADAGGATQKLRTLEKEGGGFGPRGGEFGAASSEYSPLVQATHAAAGYYRDPRRLEQYLSQASFLPDLNLERPVPAAAGQGEGAWERAAAGGVGAGAGAGGRAEILKLSKFVLILGERDEVTAPILLACQLLRMTDRAYLRINCVLLLMAAGHRAARQCLVPDIPPR
jgi:hypothetical protein